MTVPAIDWAHGHEEPHVDPYDTSPVQPPELASAPEGELSPYADELRRDVELAGAVRDLLRQRRAREIAAEVEERRRGHPLPDAGTLAEPLARPDACAWRIDGLLPANGRLLWSAQRKTGKTTAVNNLARALLTGEPFLGRFPVQPLAGRVAVLNYEVTGEQFARWAADVGVPPDRLYVINLRGRRNLLADEEGRAQLVQMVREQDGQVLVVDPFGRAYTGKSQNDSAEVTPWLVRLDEVAEQVGVGELVLTAHAGWDGERTRGSSALEDWPDVIVTMTRDQDTDDRFIKAEGRDVELDEDRLTFDPRARRLSLSGAGSRRQVKTESHLERLVVAVRDAVAEKPGLSVAALRTVLQARGEHFQKPDVSTASAIAEQRGWVRVEKGVRGAREHFPPASRTDPDRPGPGPRVARTDPLYRAGPGHGPSLDPTRTGTCAVCGEAMTLLEDGQTTHPTCGTGE